MKRFSLSKSHDSATSEVGSTKKFDSPVAEIDGVKVPIRTPGTIGTVALMMEQFGETDIGLRLRMAATNQSTNEGLGTTLHNQLIIGLVIMAVEQGALGDLQPGLYASARSLVETARLMKTAQPPV